MSFPILAPLVFASSAFVPVSTMPGWLQVFAKHQPVTAAVDAVRALMLGGPTATYVLRRWPGASGSSSCSHPRHPHYRKVK